MQLPTCNRKKYPLSFNALPVACFHAPFLRQLLVRAVAPPLQSAHKPPHGISPRPSGRRAKHMISAASGHSGPHLRAALEPSKARHSKGAQTRRTRRKPPLYTIPATCARRAQRRKFLVETRHFIPRRPALSRLVPLQINGVMGQRRGEIGKGAHLGNG